MRGCASYMKYTYDRFLRPQQYGRFSYFRLVRRQPRDLPWVEVSANRFPGEKGEQVPKPPANVVYLAQLTCIICPRGIGCPYIPRLDNLKVGLRCEVIFRNSCACLLPIEPIHHLRLSMLLPSPDSCPAVQSSEG